MESPKISIALATFNGEKYLTEQLLSIVKQSIPPYEIIACDDKSHDDTVKILKLFQKELPITIFVNEMPLGINKNFQKAISHCTGNYIAICDQDDIWFETKLEKLYSQIIKMDNNLPALVRSNSTMMSADMKGNRGVVFGKRDYKGIYKKFFKPKSQGAGMLFNSKLKDLIIPFPLKIHAYDFYISMVAELFGNSYFISEPLMYYRIHESNAVGVTINTSFINRFINLIKGNFSFYVPNAFITLGEIKDNKKLKLHDRQIMEIDNILSLNNENICRIRKVFLLHKNSMSNLYDRLLISLKLILINRKTDV